MTAGIIYGEKLMSMSPRNIHVRSVESRLFHFSGGLNQKAGMLVGVSARQLELKQSKVSKLSEQLKVEREQLAAA